MESKKICTMCNGDKMVQGQCECNMEWRSSDGKNNLEDWKCEPEQECPACKGTGLIELNKIKFPVILFGSLLFMR